MNAMLAELKEVLVEGFEKVFCYKCHRWYPATKIRTVKDSVGRNRFICERCYRGRR